MASISVTNLDAFRVWISNELVMLPTFSADPHAVSDLLAEQFTKEISPSDAQTACIAHLTPLLGKDASSFASRIVHAAKTQTYLKDAVAPVDELDSQDTELEHEDRGFREDRYDRKSSPSQYDNRRSADRDRRDNGRHRSDDDGNHGPYRSRDTDAGSRSGYKRARNDWDGGRADSYHSDRRRPYDSRDVRRRSPSYDREMPRETVRRDSRPYSDDRGYERVDDRPRSSASGWGRFAASTNPSTHSSYAAPNRSQSQHRPPIAASPWPQSSSAPPAAGLESSASSVKLVNVSKEINLPKLIDHFRKFGEITNISIKSDAGIAFVQFNDASAAQAAANSEEPVCGDDYIRIALVNRQAPVTTKKPIRAAPAPPQRPPSTAIHAPRVHKPAPSAAAQIARKMLDEKKAEASKLHEMITTQKELLAKMKALRPSMSDEQYATMMKKANLLATAIQQQHERLSVSVSKAKQAIETARKHHTLGEEADDVGKLHDELNAHEREAGEAGKLHEELDAHAIEKTKNVHSETFMHQTATSSV